MTTTTNYTLTIKTDNGTTHPVTDDCESAERLYCAWEHWRVQPERSSAEAHSWKNVLTTAEAYLEDSAVDFAEVTDVDSSPADVMQQDPLPVQGVCVSDEELAAERAALTPAQRAEIDAAEELARLRSAVVVAFDESAILAGLNESIRVLRNTRCQLTDGSNAFWRKVDHAITYLEKQVDELLEPEPEAN